MRLKISHTTTYSYDTPVHYALQQLRLRPKQGVGQTVLDWSSEVSGGEVQLEFDDHYGNHTELVIVDEGAQQIRISCGGTVEVENLHGVLGRHRGLAPLWLFKEPTAITQPGPKLRALARRVRAEHGDIDDISFLHDMSGLIASEVAYETGRTDSTTSAEDALSSGTGVCQDHAHIMVAVARLLDHPARYVSGYLMMNDRVEQDASHAWCEVWIESLGWVGFDVSNGISPDDRYVRVATGRDYRDAAPILGLRQGAGSEELHVALQVQQ